MLIKVRGGDVSSAHKQLGYQVNKAAKGNNQQSNVEEQVNGMEGQYTNHQETEFGTAILRGGGPSSREAARDNDASTESGNDGNKEKSKFRGYLCVIGGMCIHLFCGNQYLWGNIANYVVSYYHYQGDPNATSKISFVVKPISTCATIAFASLGSFLIKRFRLRVLMTAGSIVMLSSVFMASCVKTWWPFVIFYAVLYPMGVGMVYWPAIICSWEWFPERKGLISGLIVGAYGLGAFIFSFVSTAVVNPNNQSPAVPMDGSGTTDKLFSKEVSDRVPTMFRVCLICWAALCFAAICLVSRNPEFVKKEEAKTPE